MCVCVCVREHVHLQPTAFNVVETTQISLEFIEDAALGT